MAHPYKDLWARALDPAGYYKWQMNRIDQCRQIYEKCSTQFDINPSLIQDLKLKKSFNTWYSCTVLHVWMINSRLRAEGKEGKEVTQGMTNILIIRNL